jgi:hypothetical protein
MTRRLTSLLPGVSIVRSAFQRDEGQPSSLLEGTCADYPGEVKNGNRQSSPARTSTRAAASPPFALPCAGNHRFLGCYPLLLRRKRRCALRRIDLRFSFQVSHALERYLFLIPQLSQALFRISHSSFRVPTRQDDRASKENVLL